MRCGFAWASIFAGMPIEPTVPSPSAATPPVTKLRRLIVASFRFRAVPEASPLQHPQAAKDRREMPELCIGASPAVATPPRRSIWRRSWHKPTCGQDNSGALAKPGTISVRRSCAVMGGLAAVKAAQGAGTPLDIGNAPLLAGAEQFENNLFGLAGIHKGYNPGRLERAGILYLNG